MDFRATNDNNNRNNIDNEMGALEKFESELKNTVFGVMFVLLKEQEISIYTSFILAILQFLQLLIFPFHKTINTVWNSQKVVDVLDQIFNYFNIVPYLDDTNWNLYTTFFYIGIAMIGVVLINILYVSYAFSRKKFSFTFPIVALRYLLTLFITVLFLPYIDYFVSMMACVENTNTGQIVHSYFTEVECWNGIHILHAIFAIFGIITFFVITAVSSLTFFEYKSVSNDPSARINARPNFIFLVYKLVMVICLTFLTGDQFQVLLLALILVGSLILFIKFYFGSPYHNETVSKLWSTLTAVNLWTAVMLVFAKIMENTLFEGSIIAWLLGIPFVVLIILTNRDHRVDLLLINVNKFQNGQEIQDQIRYLLKLIEWQATNRNSAILLDGYIEIHKQSCNQDDCPLKQKAVKNNRFTKNLMSQDETLNEKYAVLIQLLYKMYSQGIKKFPNNTSLRIAFAFFLLEKMQSKQQALQELSQAEQNKPPFDEQFIIYRYKKIVEDEIAESQTEGQGGLDVVSEIAFQNHLRQLQANIEKSALLHMEFWSQLSEDNPDLSKLNDIGSKINSSVHNVEEHWTKLLKINQNNAKAMRLYGKFLIEIINDKEAGDELIEKARTISNVQSNKKAIQMVGATGDDYNSDATPTVWVSGEADKFGLITGINLAAASMFGYNKTELVNRKVNSLMPQIYGKHHDSFLQNYIDTGEGSLIGKNKERLVFGKNKSNYIFPIYISLRAVQSIIQGIQFIATFRVEKNFKNTAYVLTQPDGSIDSISSSCISLLKIDLKMINQKKANLQDYIPNIIKERFNVFSSTTAGRTSASLTYEFPKDSEYLLDQEDSHIQLNCHLYELLFLGGRENAGFQFRFERMLDKSMYLGGDRKAKISNFQFRFEKARACVIGEYAEGSTTTEVQEAPEEDLLGGIQNTDQNSDPGRDVFNSATKRSDQEEEPEVERVNYGAGIKTLRLLNGRAVEIEDDRESQDSQADPEADPNPNAQTSQNKQHQQIQQEEDQQEEGSYREFSTTFKSRKALTTIVNDKTPPTAIKSLRYTANFLVLILFLIALLDYIFANNEFDKINNDVELLDKSNLRLAEMMNVLSKVRDLYLINAGVINDVTRNGSATDSIYYNSTVLRGYLKDSLDSAKSLKEQLEQETSSLSTAHINLLNSPIISLVSLDGNNTYKGLTQATEEVISRAFNLLSRTDSDIVDTNSDYYYVTQNLLNDYYSALKTSSGYYAQELSDRVNAKGTSFLIVLIVSIATLFLALLILFPIMFQVNKTREEVLSLFLDIPEKTVKGLYNKCETFISNLQVGEDEDMISEIDDEELEKQPGEHETQDFIPRRRRKRFKNLGRSQRTLFIKFLGVALVIEAYFLFTFISANLLLEDISTLIPELNSTSAAEGFFSFANNAERQLLMKNNTLPILGAIASDIVTNNIKAMYDLDSLILEEHSINRKIHTEEYANVFNQLMMSNPCSYMTTLVLNATCVAFADQTVYQGMTVALSRHFENLRTILSCWTKIGGGGTCTISPPIPKTLSTDSFKNSTLNLLRTTQSTEINSMQHVYIKQTFRTLMTNFKASLRDTFSNQLTVRLIVFIIFIVGLATIYLFLWQIFIAKITNEIWRTKSMLNMIPLNVISKIKSIRLYLKRFWNERNLSEY